MHRHPRNCPSATAVSSVTPSNSPPKPRRERGLGEVELAERHVDARVEVVGLVELGLDGVDGILGTTACEGTGRMAERAGHMGARGGS